MRIMVSMMISAEAEPKIDHWRRHIDGWPINDRWRSIDDRRRRAIIITVSAVPAIAVRIRPRIGIIPGRISGRTIAGDYRDAKRSADHNAG